MIGGGVAHQLGPSGSSLDGGSSLTSSVLSFFFCMQEPFLLAPIPSLSRRERQKSRASFKDSSWTGSGVDDWRDMHVRRHGHPRVLQQVESIRSHCRKEGGGFGGGA